MSPEMTELGIFEAAVALVSSAFMAIQLIRSRLFGGAEFLMEFDGNGKLVKLGAFLVLILLFIAMALGRVWPELVSFLAETSIVLLAGGLLLFFIYIALFYLWTAEYIWKDGRTKKRVVMGRAFGPDVTEKAKALGHRDETQLAGVQFKVSKLWEPRARQARAVILVVVAWLFQAMLVLGALGVAWLYTMETTPPVIKLTRMWVIPVQAQFVSGSAELIPDSAPQAAADIAQVKSFAPALIIVQGHTDSVGTEADNLELSRQRADTMEAYLRPLLPDVRAWEKVGLGENCLRSEETGPIEAFLENQRQKNRRVQLILLQDPADADQVRDMCEPELEDAVVSGSSG